MPVEELNQTEVPTVAASLDPLPLQPARRVGLPIPVAGRS